MLFDIVREQIRKNKEIRESGGYVGIPVPHKRLSEYWPSLERGHSIAILGATGVSKSRYGRYLGVYTPYKFYKETGYKTRVFYFPLEDNKEKVMKNMICHYLKENNNVTISLQELNSVGNRSLPQFIMDHIDEAKDFYKEFEQVVTVLDGYNTPQEIFDVVEYYLLQEGKIEEYEVDIAGRKEKQKRYTSDTHVIVLVDNFSNIDMDKGHATERAAVVDFAKNFGRALLCNLYKCTLLQILQTDFQTERMQYGSDGKAIMSKVEPNLSSVGDAKTVTRSNHLVISLFDPHRYNFLTYPQISQKALESDPEAANKVYKIDILGNKFKVLKILKNNDSDSGISVGLFFNALTENFEELPPADSQEMQNFYGKLVNKNQTGFVKTKTQIQAPISFNDDETPF